MSSALASLAFYSLCQTESCRVSLDPKAYSDSRHQGFQENFIGREMFQHFLIAREVDEHSKGIFGYLLLCELASRIPVLRRVMNSNAIPDNP